MIVKINIDRPMTQNPKPQFGFSEPWSCVFNGVQQWFQVQLLIGTVVIFSQQQSCSYFLPEVQCMPLSWSSVFAVRGWCATLSHFAIIIAISSKILTCWPCKCYNLQSF
jgi:hypothetical protein